MLNFEENPNFLPSVERASLRALDDLGDEVKRDAGAEISPFSSGAAKAIRKERARKTVDGPTVTISIGKGLGTIFEFSKMQNRLTKGKGKKQKYPPGVNRGVMQRHEFFNKTIEDKIAKGLPLGRYL